MIFNRTLSSKLIKEIDTPEIVVLTGMRRTGKTTLMNQVFEQVESKNKLYLDLENPLNQKIFEEVNYDNIWHNLATFGIDNTAKTFLFLDEVQVFPPIVKAVKYLFDHYSVKFFLTGSSSFYLKNLFSESLAGRKVVYELFPLNFSEFLMFKDKKVGKQAELDFSALAEKKNSLAFELNKGLYEEYLFFGGFPGVVVEKDRERKKVLLEDIFKSYFEKDVKNLSDFKDLSKLRDLLLLLAKRTGSKVDISKISSEIGVSRETVYNYLSFLEKTYFIFLVSPFSLNTDREVSGARKVYFCDTGILNYLGVNDEGVIFENAVFRELSRHGKVNYYQKRKGAEIDFILNEEIGFEVKLKPDFRDLKRLGKTASPLGLKDYFLISRDYTGTKNTILGVDL